MSKYDFIALLIIAAMMVGMVFLARWHFTAVLASDFPDWVKYLLLR